jgi:hypothetical protein
MEAYDELDTHRPKMSIRIGARAPGFLCGKIARILRQGKTGFVLTNDDVTIPRWSNT